MNKELVPHEQSLELRELGLKVKSPYWYNPNGVLLMKSFECNDETESVNVKNIIDYWDSVIKDRIDVPTFSQAFSWFRENYELDSEIYMNHEYGVKFYTYLVLKLEKLIVSHKSGYAVKQNTYEEAELECLKKLIKIVK